MCIESKMKIWRHFYVKTKSLWKMHNAESYWLTDKQRCQQLVVWDDYSTNLCFFCIFRRDLAVKLLTNWQFAMSETFLDGIFVFLSFFLLDKRQRHAQRQHYGETNRTDLHKIFVWITTSEIPGWATTDPPGGNRPAPELCAICPAKKGKRTLQAAPSRILYIHWHFRARVL